MDLVVHGNDGTAVTAVAGLETLLEHGSLAVRLDAVAAVLSAIRDAALAVTPQDAAILEADPVRMATMAATILAVANAARALAAAAPANDQNAATLVQALDQLHIYPTEPTVIENTIMAITASDDSSWPVFRFPRAGRVLGAYYVTNTPADSLEVSMRNAGIDDHGTVVVADPTGGTVVPGVVYPFTINHDLTNYDSGELVVIDVSTDEPAVFSVQIDYQLD